MLLLRVLAARVSAFTVLELPIRSEESYREAQEIL
jgi:hypothetical protein